jgi:hypothetical protein
MHSPGLAVMPLLLVPRKNRLVEVAQYPKTRLRRRSKCGRINATGGRWQLFSGRSRVRQCKKTPTPCAPHL